MSYFRIRLAAALGTVLLLTAAQAQTSSTPAVAGRAPSASTTDASKSGTVADVETWTNKQWQAAKKEWAKDQTKWADCRGQSDKQKLAGRKSWSFLYTCLAA